MKQAFEHLARDPVLEPLLRDLHLEPIAVSENVYESLIESIVSQQLSVKAASTIHGRFLDLFPNRIPDPKLLLELGTEQLRSAGLSGQKSGYIEAIARTFLEWDLLHRDFSKMSDEEIIETLTAIRGVGVWTVHMLLIFTLGRLDVFAPGDLIVKQGIVKLYWLQETGKALDKRLWEISEAWSPYRSVACRIMWKRKDMIYQQS